MADRGTWKIVIGGATLVDYPDVANARANDGGPIVQTEALFRATDIKNFERGNFALNLVFDIVKEQANNAASVDFFLKGPQTWSGKKDVALSHKDHTGTETTRYIAGASVKLRCEQPIGVTNVAMLTIVGKQVANS